MNIFRTFFNYLGYEMTITIVLRSGENVKLVVLSTDKISNLKNQIQQLKGIDADKQMIIHNGNQLNDEDSLSEQGVINDAILTLVGKHLKKDARQGTFSSLSYFK